MPIKKDTIFINKLEVSCKVGDSKEERAFPQILWISLEIELPLQKAGQNDNISESVDYAEIVLKINQILKKREYILVEAVAESIATLLLDYGPVQSAGVRVEKKPFPGLQSVGVAIWREKKK